MDDPVDLLVVGAGVIGLASAWRAAQRGLTVRVVERAHAGAGASTAAAGILAPSDPEDWRGERGAGIRDAITRWPAFAAELEDAAGASIGFRVDGGLRLALDEAELPDLEDVAAGLRSAGVEHVRLDAAGVAAEEPGVRGAIAGLLVPDDAQVATDRLVAGLARACLRAGVRLDEGVEPAATLQDPDGRVTGLRLSDGTSQPAGLTLAAIGAWSATAAWLPEPARPAVRPLAGEWLLLRGEPVCRRVLRTAQGSIVPRDDGVHWVGTTVRDAGYPAAPRADALAAILGHWTAVVPASGRLELVRAGVGLRPASVDGMPRVGPSSIPGLAIATGHGRSGIVHAPVAAAEIAELAAGTLPRSTPNSPKPDRT